MDHSCGACEAGAQSSTIFPHQGMVITLCVLEIYRYLSSQEVQPSHDLEIKMRMFCIRMHSEW